MKRTTAIAYMSEASTPDLPALGNAGVKRRNRRVHGSPSTSLKEGEQSRTLTTISLRKWRSHAPYGTWRRDWDSNPGEPFGLYTLSRRAP
jgi:hypothetical protein